MFPTKYKILFAQARTYPTVQWMFQQNTKWIELDSYPIAGKLFKNKYFRVETQANSFHNSATSNFTNFYLLLLPSRLVGQGLGVD